MTDASVKFKFPWLDLWASLQKAVSAVVTLLPKLRVNCGCGRRDNMQVIEAIAFVGIFLETTGGTWKRKEEF